MASPSHLRNRTGRGGQKRARRGLRWFEPAVLGLFALLGVLQLVVHEPWRDEWQAWMLARDSSCVGELFENLRYEDYPPLWHLLLFGLSRLTRDIMAMRVAHLIIGMAGAAVVLWHAPFSRVNRALLVLGYFPLFEYLAVSRPCVMTVALLFTYCWLRWNPERQGSSPALPALVLAGMALTTVYGVLPVLCILTVELTGLIRAKGPEGPAPSGRVVVLLTGVLAVAVSAWSMLPPADAGVNYPWVLGVRPSRLGSVVIDVAQALVPFGRSLYPVRWNSTFLELAPRPALMASGLVVVTLGGFLHALRRRLDAVAPRRPRGPGRGRLHLHQGPGVPTPHRSSGPRPAGGCVVGLEWPHCERVRPNVATGADLTARGASGRRRGGDRVGCQIPLFGEPAGGRAGGASGPDAGAIGHRRAGRCRDIRLRVAGPVHLLSEPRFGRDAPALGRPAHLQLPRVPKCHRRLIRDVLLDPVLRRDRPIFVTDRRLRDPPGARLVGATGRSMADTERYYIYELEPLRPPGAGP